MDNLALLCFYWLFWEEAYLLSGILAPLQIMISVWEDLRLYNRHQAILQEKGRVHEKKRILWIVCEEELTNYWHAINCLESHKRLFMDNK